MFTKTKISYLLSFCFVLLFAFTFQSCVQDNAITPETPSADQNIFQKHLNDSKQTIQAPDLGNGTYAVTGKQGTVIEINDALVNAAGERVRGTVEIQLIEIYTVADMILNRKQTLADYNGQVGMLESGGEVFVKVYQNGEELSVDGQGNMNILLPTVNTGGAKENMELFYGEEVGAQVMWKPTGEKIQVINNDILRDEESYYMMVITNTLGWLNVDVLRELGEFIECIGVEIECDFPCEINAENTVVAANVPGFNSGFELQYQGGNSFQICGDGNIMALGGIQVTFIVVIDCGEGNLWVSFVTVTLSTSGSHTEVIYCEGFHQMNEDEFLDQLGQLN